MKKNLFRHLPILLVAVLQLLMSIPAFTVRIFLLVEIFLSAVMVFFILHFYIIPTEKLVRMNKALIDTDLKQLSIAISEFSRGNISFTIPQAGLISPRISVPGSLGGLDAAYRDYHASVSDIINEFRSISAIPCARINYVGADSYLEGQKCGEVLGKMLDGKGQVAIIVFSLSNTGQYLRRKGFINSVNREFPEMEIIKIAEDKRDDKLAYATTRALVRDYPELVGIYVASGKAPPIVAKALAESGKAGVIKVVCHDLTDSTVKAIEAGVISAALSQNPYVQGHDSVILMANYLFRREEPLVKRRLTLLETITAENIKEFWDSTDGLKLSDKTVQLLAEPLIEGSLPESKIAIILPSRTGFWKPVYEGVSAATAELETFKIRVSIEIPDSIARGDFSAAAFRTEMEELISRGFNAFCLPHFDVDLTAYINSLSVKGVPVITLNSEPLNFRGMLEGVYKHTLHLFTASESLAASSTQTSQATSQITKTMKLISESTEKQVGQIDETRKQIDILTKNIGDIAESSGQNEEITKQTRDRAESSARFLKSSNESLQETAKMILQANELTEQLDSNSKQINEIITFIDDLASQTRMISMNASILAARAGSSGKGFSVLASEIRRLSEKSDTSTRKISVLVRETLGEIGKISSMIMDEVEIIKTAMHIFGTSFQGRSMFALL
ncbi:MAG: substrate-binding domain-containing protein [Spirochaetales bacterium]|nr:substrate-binding domain-containing protein [Spirochaetales bacterium]